MICNFPKDLTMHKISMLGSGFITMFYTKSLHSGRDRDRVHAVYSRTSERAQEFTRVWDITKATFDLVEAINDPETDFVVIGLPNDQHLEDLVYTPKTLKAVQSVRNSPLGKILWARSRETHPGLHSDWFWNKEISGGGAIVDMGSHYIEICRHFTGKDVRPVEVICRADTQAHPIEAEDTAVGLVRYANGAIGQFEVSWAFRGGMDLRDEVSGTEGTIWPNHWLHTGFEMFTFVGEGGYVADKAETDIGWLIPGGDEPGSLEYTPMFADMLDALDEGHPPLKTFYDGYIVNAIMDSAYRSADTKRWEPVEIEDWRVVEGKESHGKLIGDASLLDRRSALSMTRF
jgi:predicted dehydrogenase